jgi:hypothetical protein
MASDVLVFTYAIVWNADVLAPEPCATCHRIGIPSLGASIIDIRVRWHVCDRCAPQHAPELWMVVAAYRKYEVVEIALTREHGVEDVPF